MDYLKIWFGGMAVTIVLARLKNRRMLVWGLLGLVAGPLAALLILFRKRLPEHDPYADPDCDTSGIILRAGDVVEGLHGRIEIGDNAIAIKRKGGFGNLMLHGLKGEKRIPFTSITAVQLRMPNRVTSGYLQFSLLGGREGSAGIMEAASDENTIMFLREHAPRMVALRDMVENRLARGSAAPATTSIADELTKLADLHDRGLLTSDELAIQKRNLLK